MTSEHIIITEEVQKDGQIVTVERETLQTTMPTPDEVKGTQAYGVTHPGYTSAEDRVYTYNEATGLSESEPRPDFGAMTVDELRDYARKHDINLHDAHTKEDIVNQLTNEAGPAVVVEPKPVVVETDEPKDGGQTLEDEDEEAGLEEEVVEDETSTSGAIPTDEPYVWVPTDQPEEEQPKRGRGK